MLLNVRPEAGFRLWERKAREGARMPCLLKAHYAYNHELELILLFNPFQLKILKSGGGIIN